jgi:lipoprotein-releasing system permease protein
LNLPLYIAKRYLISKKNRHIINIISGIAATGICVGTFALVVVLSVFNGFDSLIKSYFSILDPDLKIIAKEGKFFNPDVFTKKILPQLSGIADYALVIEDNALLTYNNRQFIATLKGVTSNFGQITGIDSLIVDGAFILEKNSIEYAIPGQGVATYLGLNTGRNEPIQVYVPKKGIKSSLDPSKALNFNYIYASGVYSLLEEVDSHLIFVPLSFARTLFESPGMVSALELNVSEGFPEKKIRKAIVDQVGKNYHVKNKYQQHDSLYKTMMSEKWATYLILAFILIIASFNILGSLSMLIIDKKEDILILRSMGASPQLIKKIFLFEGWLIAILGSVTGLLLGVLICWIQIHFGIIPLPGEGSFVVSAYPVEIQIPDLMIILSVVILIGFLAAWYPVSLISRTNKVIDFTFEK